MDELNESNSIGVLITPRTRSPSPVREGSNSVAPLPIIWSVVTLNATEQVSMFLFQNVFGVKIEHNE
jgi:hypothetical protein